MRKQKFLPKVWNLNIYAKILSVSILTRHEAKKFIIQKIKSGVGDGFRHFVYVWKEKSIDGLFWFN